MPLTVHRSFFTSAAGVLDDIKANGFWPTTFVSEASPGLPVHWHAEEVHAYVMEGETDFLDVESGERLPARAGDKVVIPARCLHAEGEVKARVVYILALPAPLAQRDFLKMRRPEALTQ